MKKIFIGLVLLLPGVVTQPVLAEANIKTGLWEVTTQVEMKGMPVQALPVTTQQCFDKENYVPINPQQQGDCKISPKQIDEDTITWTLVCHSDRGELKGQGEITYNGDTFNGSSSMQLKTREGVLNMDSTLSGRYLGACE